MKQTEFASSYLSEFYMELHLMIRAGLPFQEGIALLLDEEQQKTKKQFLQQLYQALEQGETLADALKHTHCIPHYAVEMVAIGQNTGHLEQAFYGLSCYYDRMNQIRQSVHNLLWYPTILLAMMLMVVLVLLIKVMPVFADIFLQLGAELSPAAQLMLDIGQLLYRYGIPILAVIAGVGILVYLWSRTAKGAVLLTRLTYRMTASWNVRELLTASRLADALVLTMSSGMNVDDALEMAGTLAEEPRVQAKIAACRASMLTEGCSFADAAMEQQLFAPMYCRMIAVGFRVGDIDTTMAEVARRIADDADDAMDALLNRIEPTLVILLSLMVGLILLSVMLPLAGIMTAIG